MSNEFKLVITSSDREFFSGNSEGIVLPATDGEHGVLAGHESMVIAIVSGECRFKENGVEHTIAVGKGFAEIRPNEVDVIVDTAEYPEEINEKRAEEAKIRAEEALRQKQSILEYHHTQAALSRAMTRLKVKGH